MKNIVLFSIILSISQIAKSQDLKKHQWKNRLLLVFSDDKNSDTFQKQINVLSENTKGLKERKLIIYQFSENKFSIDFNSKWFPIHKLSKKYHSKNKRFEVLLIGLDGGIKLRQTKLVSLDQLFTLIDGMPMRRHELKN